MANRAEEHANEFIPWDNIIEIIIVIIVDRTPCIQNRRTNRIVLHPVEWMEIAIGTGKSTGLMMRWRGNFKERDDEVDTIIVLN